MITKTYLVYGFENHRQKASFWPSASFCVTRDGEEIQITIENEDRTGTNEYSRIRISASSLDLIEKELTGQISDGYFENCRVGCVGKVDVLTFPWYGTLEFLEPEEYYTSPLWSYVEGSRCHEDGEAWDIVFSKTLQQYRYSAI